MLRTIKILLLLLLVFIYKTAVARQQDYPFKLKTSTIAGQQMVIAQNNGPAPIWVNVNLLNPVNATIDRPSPIAVLVPPCNVATIATVQITVPGRQYQISTNYKFSIGNTDAVQSHDATYLLPFQNGQEIRVGQVQGGIISTHSSPASRYAVDFSVPTGTAIVAARKGQVVDVDRDYSEGGANPLLKANHVLILHEDGTLGLYSHLAQGRVPVTFGQWVDAGELIAYSGDTGYSTGPHLHFVVLTNTRTTDGAALYLSQPVKFVNGDKPYELKLRQGDKLVTIHKKVPPVPANTVTGQQEKCKAGTL